MWTHSVWDVVPFGAEAISFMWALPGRQPRQVTVEQYYQEQYNCRLQYPRLYLLNVGSKDRPSYLPAEFCT